MTERPKAPATVARAAERTRIAAILTAPEAEGRGALAQHFAFKTDLPVETAVEALAASPKEGTGGLAGAMAGRRSRARARRARTGAGAMSNPDLTAGAAIPADAAPARHPDYLLDRRGVERDYGIPVRTLELAGHRGTGPIVTRIGRRCYYRRADVETWIAARRDGRSE
jgi:hypothetical protein